MSSVRFTLYSMDGEKLSPMLCGSGCGAALTMVSRSVVSENLCGAAGESIRP